MQELGEVEFTKVQTMVLIGTLLMKDYQVIGYGLLQL